MYVDKISAYGKNKHFPFPYHFILLKLFENTKIKPIINTLKCKKRQKKYEIMWISFIKENPIPYLKICE